MRYKVGVGDSPARIAHRMTGNAGRLGELVLANPHKRAVPTGLAGVKTFASLGVGEFLNIPPSWTRRRTVGLGDAASIQTEISALQAAAGTAPVADADGSYASYIVAAQAAGLAAAVTDAQSMPTRPATDAMSLEEL